MRSDDLYDLLERAVLALDLDGITAADVVRPNVVFDAEDRDLYFETFVGDYRASRDTERATIGRCSCAIVVCGRRGEERGRVDRIVEDLLEAFAPRSCERLDGLSSALSDGTIESRVYALNAARASPRVVDGRYKVTVTIELEIWED